MRLAAGNRVGPATVWFLFLLFLALPFSLEAETTHEVYLKGTESELDAYFIKGRFTGPTLMLVGGIQGDEPGGYLAADLYADIALKKGNMIVVPRANFRSIVDDARGLSGDMNRKFAGRPVDADADIRVVDIIKGLMKKSDFFLNLHDGSGFYAPTWESPMRNPRRYGQSIIVDAERHVGRDGNILEVGEIARRVMAKVNPQISDERHIFQFNNHRTEEKDTKHIEQRLSATFHALTQTGIPAFGIETSKSIPDYRLRVRYQTLLINAFLEEFGIVQEHPKIYLDTPVLKYLIVSINGRTPIVAKGSDVLKVYKGDRVRIVHIESNYTRGLTARIKGQAGRLNYLNTDIVATEDLGVQVAKDRFLMATVPVEIIRNPSTEIAAGVQFEPKVDYFCVSVNDRTYVLEPGEEITVMRGDQLVILDPKTNLSEQDEKAIRIDLRGYQPPGVSYPADDRHYLICTDRDLQPKYALPRGPLTLYPLQAKLKNKVFAQSFLAVTEPRLDYLVVRGTRGPDFVVHSGDKLEVPGEEVVRIVDVRTNLPDTTPLSITMAGRTVRWQRDGVTGIDASKLGGGEARLEVTRGGRSIGAIWVKQGKELLISSGKKTPYSPILPVQYTPEN